MRANGVRSGIVNVVVGRPVTGSEAAGKLIAGKSFPVIVTVPLLSTGPPLSVSPTHPDAPALKSCRPSRAIFVMATPGPLKVTWKPVLLNVPAPKPATATVPRPVIASISASIPAAV